MPLHLFPHFILTTTPGGISMNPLIPMKKEAQRGEAHPKPPHSRLAICSQQQCQDVNPGLPRNPTLSVSLRTDWATPSSNSCTITQSLWFTCLPTGSKIGHHHHPDLSGPPRDWAHGAPGALRGGLLRKPTFCFKH